MPKSKAYSNPLPSMADEQRYSTKCHELRAKIREMERENQNIQLKIHQSKKNISRLRIERSILYDSLATVTTTAAQAADLAIPPQAQPSHSNPQAASTSLSNPSPACPSIHNGYHPPSAPTGHDRPFNDSSIPPNNHSQPPTRTVNRSTEPAGSNGITGLLNSTHSNSLHAPPPSRPTSSAPAPSPPISHAQYSSNLQAQNQISHDLPIPSSHRRTPANSYSPATAPSPTTTSNNHFPHHSIGARSTSASSHRPSSHARYSSPHHHHHHHHQVENPSHTNPGSSTVLPSLRAHPMGAQTLSNGSGGPLRTDGGHMEGDGEEDEGEEEADDDDEEEEEEELEEVDGSTKPGSTSMRAMEDEMEIDAEGDEEE